MAKVLWHPREKQFTVAQFAHKLKVNRSTVYRMISSKSLPQGVTAVTRLGRIEIHIDGWLFDFPTGEIKGLDKLTRI